MFLYILKFNIADHIGIRSSAFAFDLKTKFIRSGDKSNRKQFGKVGNGDNENYKFGKKDIHLRC